MVCRLDFLHEPKDEVLLLNERCNVANRHMKEGRMAAPDSSAVRVALWRALHVQVDAPPHVLEDEIGLQLAAPDEGWRQRPDMDPLGTSLFRASIVARARFVEDLVIHEEVGASVNTSFLEPGSTVLSSGGPRSLRH